MYVNLFKITLLISLFTFSSHKRLYCLFLKLPSDIHTYVHMYNMHLGHAALNTEMHESIYSCIHIYLRTFTVFRLMFMYPKFQPILRKSIFRQRSDCFHARRIGSAPLRNKKHAAMDTHS